MLTQIHGELWTIPRSGGPSRAPIERRSDLAREGGEAIQESPGRGFERPSERVAEARAGRRWWSSPPAGASTAGTRRWRTRRTGGSRHRRSRGSRRARDGRRLERATHPVECAAHPHPNRPLPHTECVGELGVPHAMAKAEHDECPTRFVQARQRALHVRPAREEVWHERLGIDRGVVLRGLERVGRAALPTEVIETAVARDGEEPRPRGGVSAEALERGECSVEGVLREVLRGRRVANHRSAEPEHVRRHRLDQPLRRFTATTGLEERREGLTQRVAPRRWRRAHGTMNRG